METTDSNKVRKNNLIKRESSISLLQKISIAWDRCVSVKISSGIFWTNNEMNKDWAIVLRILSVSDLLVHTKLLMITIQKKSSQSWLKLEHTFRSCKSVRIILTLQKSEQKPEKIDSSYKQKNDVSWLYIWYSWRSDLGCLREEQRWKFRFSWYCCVLLSIILNKFLAYFFSFSLFPNMRLLSLEVTASDEQVDYIISLIVQRFKHIKSLSIIIYGLFESKYHTFVVTFEFHWRLLDIECWTLKTSGHYDLDIKYWWTLRLGH